MQNIKNKQKQTAQQARQSLRNASFDSHRNTQVYYNNNNNNSLVGSIYIYTDVLKYSVANKSACEKYSSIRVTCT